MEIITTTLKTMFIMFLLIIFTSCSDANSKVSDNINSKNTNYYKNDITVNEFSERFDSLLFNGKKLTAVDDDFIIGMLQLNLNDVTEYILKIQTSGTEVDQYGIFKTSSEIKAVTLSDSVKSYLDMLRDNWQNFNYLPEETPKINAAEVKTAGSYVVFVIATEDEKAAVFDEFYSMLKD